MKTNYRLAQQARAFLESAIPVLYPPGPLREEQMRFVARLSDEDLVFLANNGPVEVVLRRHAREDERKTGRLTPFLDEIRREQESGTDSAGRLTRGRRSQLH